MSRELQILEERPVETNVPQDVIYMDYIDGGGKLGPETYKKVLRKLFPTEAPPSQESTPPKPSETAAEHQANWMFKVLSKNGHKIPEEERATLLKAYVYARTADKPGSSYDQPRTPMINLFDHDLLKEIFEILRLNSVPEQAHTVSTQVFPVPDKSAIAA